MKILCGESGTTVLITPAGTLMEFSAIPGMGW